MREPSQAASPPSCVYPAHVSHPLRAPAVAPVWSLLSECHMTSCGIAGFKGKAIFGFRMPHIPTTCVLARRSPMILSSYMDQPVERPKHSPYKILTIEERWTNEYDDKGEVCGGSKLYRRTNKVKMWRSFSTGILVGYKSHGATHMAWSSGADRPDSLVSRQLQ